MRGSKTHGGGSMKKRRGRGNRGGGGRAGSGKRADQTKPSYWKEKYFGKKGLVSRAQSLKVINIIDLELKGHSEEKDGKVTIDLTKLGYGKLLSKGKATKAYSITVGSASAKALSKIKEAGGEIIGKPKESIKKEEKQGEKAE